MYQLIQTNPLRKLNRHPDPRCGVPTVSETADESALRDGLAWSPVEERPEYDTETQKLVKKPLDEAIGYTVEDLTPDEIAERVPRTQGVTKLVIMERLGAKWGTLKAVLAQLPEDAQDAWNLALEIKADNPLILTYREQLKTALTLTDEEFDALLSIEG